VLERVVKTISRYNMVPRLPTGPARVVAAVSGGPDSVAMLQILRDLGANLAGVAHFNHKLRGDESDQDEQFVAALAARCGLPFFRSESRPRKGNLEQNARRDRRDFFLQLIRDGACDRIALGHTRDDQAETVLFRILRGSGLTGLAGIHPVTDDGFVRPCIDITREELRAFLRERNIAFRQDSTNADDRFARNRIRRHLLPQLRDQWNPQIDLALAQLADLAFEEERYWTDSTPNLGYIRTAEAVELDAAVLRSLPRAVARRQIRRAIRQAKGDLKGIDFFHIEQVLDMKPGKLVLPGVVATRSFGWVRLAVSPPVALMPFHAVIPGTYENAAVRLEIGETPCPRCDNLRVDLAVPLVLRGWRPGDHYLPVGKSRDQKLKEMFQNARVPSWQRSSWPILESEGRILWTRRFGAAAECAAECAVIGSVEPVLRIWDLSKES
jgi:tRNA(Ile)-lysidine synthase